MLQKSTVIRLALVLFTLTCLVNTLLQTYASARNTDRENRIIELPPVQLFDIKAQRIIRTLPNNATFQAEANKWITSVSGISPQLTIGHSSGHIVRIPLLAFTNIVLPKETLQVKDVFLIYCPGKEPLLLVLSKERKTYLLTLNTNVKPFMKQMLELASTKNLQNEQVSYSGGLCKRNFP